jgi:hypothetical protein
MTANQQQKQRGRPRKAASEDVPAEVRFVIFNQIKIVGAETQDLTSNHLLASAIADTKGAGCIPSEEAGGAACTRRAAQETRGDYR